MTTSDISKLIFLIILIIIICLPEILRPGVTFRCINFDPCRHKELTSQCDPGNTPLDQKPVCTGNPGDLISRENMSWFLCDTKTDLSGLYGNTSMSGRSAKVNMVLAEENVTITLYGPKQREEEGNREGKGGIYCCLQNLPPSAPTNHSQCLIHIYTQGTNHNVTSDVFRSPRVEDLWVMVVAVVMLSTLTVGQFYMKAWRCRKERSVSQNRDVISKWPVRVSPQHSQGPLSRYRTSHWTRHQGQMSPIPEETTAEVRHFPEEKPLQCY